MIISYPKNNREITDAAKSKYKTSFDFGLVNPASTESTSTAKIDTSAGKGRSFLTKGVATSITTAITTYSILVVSP